MIFFIIIGPYGDIGEAGGGNGVSVGDSVGVSIGNGVSVGDSVGGGSKVGADPAVQVKCHASLAGLMAPPSFIPSGFIPLGFVPVGRIVVTLHS